MKIKLLFTAASFAVLSACATPAGGPAAQDRFDTFELTSTAPVWASYEEVYVAPITASEDLKALIGYRTRGPNDRKRPLSARDIDNKLSDLDEDVRREVKDVATLVGEPGPGVLTIAIEVTRLEANRPTQEEMASETGLSMRSVYAGAAAANITFSEGGTVIATASDSYTPVLSEVQPVVGIWSTVDRFSGRLAGKIADLLDD